MIFAKNIWWRDRCGKHLKIDTVGKIDFVGETGGSPFLQWNFKKLEMHGSMFKIQLKVLTQNVWVSRTIFWERKPSNKITNCVQDTLYGRYARYVSFAKPYKKVFPKINSYLKLIVMGVDQYYSKFKQYLYRNGQKLITSTLNVIYMILFNIEYNDK